MIDVKNLMRYHEALTDLSKFEAALTNTDVRKKLAKLQKMLHDGQTKLKKYERDIVVEQNQVSELMSKNAKWEDELKELDIDLNYISETDVEDLDAKEVKQIVEDFETTYEKIAAGKGKAENLIRSIEAQEEGIKKTMIQIKKAKQEFIALKEVYDKELEKNAPKLNELKAQVSERAKAVDPKLIERYTKIRAMHPDPLAAYKNERCSGCNMQLPSSIAITIKNSNTPVECESCGRILYIEE